MCGLGPCAREASVWEACCRYSGVINMFLNCPKKKKKAEKAKLTKKSLGGGGGVFSVIDLARQ